MLVEVTQEDREAAADLLYRGGTTTYLLCREGKMDTTPGVQAFARHRQAAIQKARADALEEAARLVTTYGDDTYSKDISLACRSITTAIRSLTVLEVSRTPSLSLPDR